MLCGSPEWTDIQAGGGGGGRNALSRIMLLKSG